jgi:hypothetical protein
MNSGWPIVVAAPRGMHGPAQPESEFFYYGFFTTKLTKNKRNDKKH